MNTDDLFLPNDRIYGDFTFSVFDFTLVVF